MYFSCKRMFTCVWASSALALAGWSGVVTAGSLTDKPECVESANGSPSATAVESHLLCLAEHAYYYDAITYGESALRSGLESATILSETGSAYAAVQERDRAQQYLERAHDLSPDDPRIAARLADVLYRRILDISPQERQARAEHGFERCNDAEGLPDQEAAQLVTELSATAEDLLNTAIAGFADGMVRYNARSLLAMLHITTQREQALPELAALVDEVAAQASTEKDAQLADFAAMLMLNLSTAYNAHGDAGTALVTANRALETADSSSVKRLVASGTARLRGDESTVDMVDVVATHAPCEQSFKMDTSH